MGIKTDSRGASEPKDPDTCIIYQLHRLFFNGAESKALADEYRQGLSYGDAKKRLLETARGHFVSLQERRDALTDAFVEDVLGQGAAKARSLAAPMMASIRKATGLD
jgi:tryptophanyl-tRNA synthetase